MTPENQSPGSETAWRIVLKVSLLVAVPAGLIYVIKLLVG